MTVCPECGSTRIVKNGKIHSGKQKHKCKDYARQFVLGPSWRRIGEEAKAKIDKLLLEKLPLSGIARVEGVSETWLQTYVNERHKAVEKQVQAKAKKGI